MNLKRIGTAIGEYAVDLFYLVDNDIIILNSVDKQTLKSALSQEVLNDFMSLERAVWKDMRSAFNCFFSQMSKISVDINHAFINLIKLKCTFLSQSAIILILCI